MRANIPRIVKTVVLVLLVFLRFPDVKTLQNELSTDVTETQNDLLTVKNSVMRLRPVNSSRQNMVLPIAYIGALC